MEKSSADLATTGGSGTDESREGNSVRIETAEELIRALNPKAKALCPILARSLVFCASVAAVLVMVFAKQTVDLDNFTFEAKFTDWGTLKYFVLANGITACYAVLVLLVPANSLLWRLVIALDVLMSLLIATSATTCADTAYRMKHGNPHANWQPYCNLVPSHCNYVMGALAASCLGAGFQVGLAFYSLNLVLNPLLVGGG